IVARPRVPATREFLYEMVRSPDFQGVYRSRAIGTSTSHQRVKPGDFFSLKVLVPSGDLIRAFTEQAAPLHRMAHCMRLKIKVRRAPGDLVRPKLISGEVAVEPLDIDPGEPQMEVTA